MSLVTVPKITIIMRKSYGQAYINMGGGRNSDEFVCWPTADLGFMDPAVGANVLLGDARRGRFRAPPPGAGRHRAGHQRLGAGRAVRGADRDRSARYARLSDSHAGSASVAAESAASASTCCATGRRAIEGREPCTTSPSSCGARSETKRAAHEFTPRGCRRRAAAHMADNAIAKSSTRPAQRARAPRPLKDAHRAVRRHHGTNALYDALGTARATDATSRAAWSLLEEQAYEHRGRGDQDHRRPDALPVFADASAAATAAIAMQQRIEHYVGERFGRARSLRIGLHSGP